MSHSQERGNLGVPLIPQISRGPAPYTTEPPLSCSCALKVNVAPQGFITVKLSPQWLHKHLGGAVPTMQVLLVGFRRSNQSPAEANFAGHEAEGAMPVKFRLHLLNLERTHMHMSIRMPEVPQCHVYSAVFAALSRLGKWRSSSTMAFSCGAVCLSASSSTIPLPT